MKREALTAFNVKYYAIWVKTDILDSLPSLEMVSSAEMPMDLWNWYVIKNVSRNSWNYTLHILAEQDFDLPVKIRKEDGRWSLQINDIFNPNEDGSIGHNIFINIRPVSYGESDETIRFIVSIMQKQRRLGAIWIADLLNQLLNKVGGESRLIEFSVHPILKHSISSILNNAWNYIKKIKVKLVKWKERLVQSMQDDIDRMDGDSLFSDPFMEEMNRMSNEVDGTHIEMEIWVWRDKSQLNGKRIAELMRSVEEYLDIDASQNQKVSHLSKFELFYHEAESGDVKSVDLIKKILKDTILVNQNRKMVIADEAEIKLRDITQSRWTEITSYLQHA